MKMGKPTEEPGLYETPDGFAVQCKVKSGSVTTWKRKKLPGATRAEALLVLEQLRREAAEEAAAKERKEDPQRTLTVFARRWSAELGRKVESTEITPKSAQTYLDNLEKFILPFFGRMNVDEVKPKTIQDWMRWVPSLRTRAKRRGRGPTEYAQEPRPYAKATLQSAWRTLRLFMAWLAIELDGRNPAREVRWNVKGPPARPKPTMSQAEVERLLDAASVESDRSVRMIIVVALVGAMRASEVSALTWADVDLDASTIEISRSHVEGALGAPKTEGSRRTVLVPPDIVAELRAYKDWQESNGVKGLPLLFPTSTGTLRQPASINYYLEKCAKRAGLTKHITSHAMRRTTNNLLRRSAGEIVARKVTGHVTQQMTEHYSDVDHDERVSALNNAFGGALNKQKQTPEA